MSPSIFVGFPKSSWRECNPSRGSHEPIGVYDTSGTFGELYPYRWNKRDISLKDAKGSVIFEQKDIEAPEDWSDTAVQIVASKYFYGDASIEGERETSVKQLIGRVVQTIQLWAKEGGYFTKVGIGKNPEYEGGVALTGYCDEDALDTFAQDLTVLMVEQRAAFNSPVWFNVGLYDAYEAGKDGSMGNWAWYEEDKTVRRVATQYEKPQCSACIQK